MESRIESGSNTYKACKVVSSLKEKWKNINSFQGVAEIKSAEGLLDCKAGKSPEQMTLASWRSVGRM